MLAVVAVLVVIRNLSALDSVPVGAYVDETSIGYNAWTISSSGVDEHGAHLPLYFTAFGEYKNPVYIYALSAILRVLPLTVTTERLPAAIFGMLMCLCVALLAWQRSRSALVTTAALALAALNPWLSVESRVGFEVIAIVAAVGAALWCLSVAQRTGRARWYLATGCLLAVAVFAYSTGRVAVALFTAALIVVEVRPAQRARTWAWTVALIPIGAAYVGLLAWNTAHPGALTARFGAISIAADGAPAATVLGRFVGNWLTYFGPDFLFLSGDHNPRHNTQFGGMLLWVMAPLLIAGLVALWRRRVEPFVRFVLLGLLVAPVSAALTSESVPHAVRASVMLPFLFAVAVEGLRLFHETARSWRGWAYVGVALALAVQGALFTVDMFATWPARSAPAFDVGALAAISRASALAGSRQLLVSSTLDQPYIQAAFVLRPPPPASFAADSVSPLLASMRIVEFDPTSPPPSSGAIAVMSAADPAPPGWQRLFTETSPTAPLAIGETPAVYTSVSVYRVG